MIFENAELYNVQEMIKPEDGRGYWLSRVPESLRQKLNPFAQYMMLFGSGSEIRFNMKGDTAKITLMYDPFTAYQGAGVAEVYFGSFSAAYLHGPVFVKNEPTEIIVKKPENMALLKELAAKHALPYDPELVRVVLPYDTQNRLIGIEGDITPAQAGQAPAVKYLCYGSSITHGASALNPTGTYAARTARHLGADLINLGSAGSCFLEREMADFIADRRDWDITTLELGINVIGQIGEMEFAKRVDYLIPRIAEANRDKWLFCIDIFPFVSGIAGVEKTNAFRQIVKDKVHALNLPRLVHIDGQELLSYGGLSFDLVHPSAQGMEEISDRLAGIIRKYISL